MYRFLIFILWFTFCVKNSSLNNKEECIVNTICNLISKAKIADSDSMIELLRLFEPLIKKYAYKLEYEDAENDLIASMIQLIYDMPEFQNDGPAVSYIKKSVHNSYVQHVQHCIELRLREDLYEPELLHNKAVDTTYEINEISIDLRCALENLSKNQRQIIVCKFFLGMSDKEIMKIMGISRQSVYKNKIKALKLLKEMLSD